MAPAFQTRSNCMLNFEFARPVSNRSAEKPSLSRHCTKAPRELNGEKIQRVNEGKESTMGTHNLHF